MEEEVREGRGEGVRVGKERRGGGAETGGVGRTDAKAG